MTITTICQNLVLAALVFIAFGVAASAMLGVSFDKGLSIVMDGIRKVCRIAPDGVWRRTAGVGGLAAVCVLITVLLSFVGDWMLPKVATTTEGLGDARVRWSVLHPDKWRDLVAQFRDTVPVDGDSPIASNSDRWEAYKVGIGRYWIRAFRLVATLGAVMVLCGAAGLALQKARRTRSLSCFAVGLLAAVVGAFAWASREGAYIERIAQAFRSHVEKVSKDAVPPMPEPLAHYFEHAK